MLLSATSSDFYLTFLRNVIHANIKKIILAVPKVKSLARISIQMISDQKFVHDGQMLLASQLVGGTKVSKE